MTGEELMSVSETTARRRNLLVSIVRGILKEKYEVTREFTVAEIETVFHFRKRDIAYNLDFFFEQRSGKFILKTEKLDEAQKIIRNHHQALGQLETAKVLFIKSFGRFYDDYETSEGFSFDHERLRRIFSDLHPVIPILHWGMLPILSKWLMINSGRLPENDIIDFYDHYHMLTALLKEIRGRGETMETKGDDTLNKEMTFSVYTRRWGHPNVYRIERTVDGWEVRHIAINGKCAKDGEGALMRNLHHDSIFFPEEGVKCALSNLWDDAEDGEIGLEELQIRLQQVADWISSVEKAVGENQPDWVQYC
ncbi:hypothetical protein Dhaf_3303 [Desulfitobacterium hafniense DCB-2]|uniref:Integron cassette protein domain-containing protein n=1 Tax=Desulfitobacterium hafniense (strain DSM 10664 / DCB-2) TaxID=272564 RepID=B8G2H1_DESHD|nr:hypothetical protein [Desulfitobacterium hafniense]ACL21321.1 hypothetical protein Dhaf_3303 [Desulfitobacterium hafniense DCB-2]